MDRKPEINSEIEGPDEYQESFTTPKATYHYLALSHLKDEIKRLRTIKDCASIKRSSNPNGARVFSFTKLVRQAS